MKEPSIFTFTMHGDHLYYCTLDHSLEMTSRFLTKDENLFQNLDVFEEDYVPENLQYRDSEADKLEDALRPALRGASPRHVLIRGVSGTGKSTTVNSLFSELNKTSHNVVAVNVNCQIERTTFGVFARIFNDLIGYEPSLTGTSTYQAVESIAMWLHEEEKVLVVCLDDANVLNSQNHLIPTLSYLLSMHEFCSGVRVGVVLTLSDMDFHLANELNSSLMSSLHPKEILFTPYDEETMFQILSERARLGFYSGVIEPDVVREVAHISYEMSNLRIGIELLKQSAYRAEQNGRKNIVSGDIDADYQDSLIGFLNSVAKNLAYKDCRLFWWAANKLGEGKGILKSGALYEAFSTEVKEGYTSFYKRMKRLESLRLLNIVPCHVKGNSSEIMLRFDPKVVMAACESIEESVPKTPVPAEVVSETLPESAPESKAKSGDSVGTVTKAKRKPKVKPEPKGRNTAKPKAVAATETVAEAASPQPGSVPVSAASGDAGGVTWQQPEPMNFTEAELRKSEGFGRNRSQKGAVT